MGIGFRMQRVAFPPCGPWSVHTQVQPLCFLCRPAQAEHGAFWMPACQPHPSPRVPWARWGWAGPGNLSQLLCPVSGKPRTGTLPTETVCPCTCLWGFLEEAWRPNPHPTAQHARPVGERRLISSHISKSTVHPSKLEPDSSKAELPNDRTRK